MKEGDKLTATAEAFKVAVMRYLKPYEGAFNYQTMLMDHLDVSRFYPWVAQVSEYKKVRGGMVLSSGCGSAGDLLAFMQSGASRVFGIEVSEGLANLARLRFRGTGFEDAFEMRIYDGGILPYEGDFFDIVFSVHVIEHTQNPRLYMTELFRVLKPGGILFLDVPNRYYAVEQHIQVKYIHFLPRSARDALIALILSRPFCRFFSEKAKYRLAAYRGFHFPSASQLFGLFNGSRASYSLKVDDAFFHSYSSERVRYRPYLGKYVLGRARRMTTFRMVIRKVNGRSSSGAVVAKQSDGHRSH